MRTALVVTALLALALAGCARDRYQSSYDDMIQAKKRDAVDRGWIPEFLPESTTKLREIHDPRTRQHVVMGTLTEGQPPDACDEVEVVGTPPLDADWLPTVFDADGRPIRCGAWDGTVERGASEPTIVLWTDWPDEGSPTPEDGDDGTGDEDAETGQGPTAGDGA